jgi:5,10-methylenetetrahydrofolate reductase
MMLGGLGGGGAAVASRGFEVWVEVPPSRKPEKLVRIARMIRGLVDAVDVPEAPMGRPSAHSIAVAHVVSREAMVPAVANIRLLDVNANALASLLGAALLLRLRGVVLLQGDPPMYGRPVGHLSTEEAVRFAREYAPALKVGVVLSLAKPPEKIAERLKLPVDFYLATRLFKPSQLEGQLQEARLQGRKVIPYIVVAEGDDKRAMYEMLKGHQPVFEPAELPSFIRAISSLVDGVLVSAPTSHKTLVEALKAANEARREQPASRHG